LFRCWLPVACFISPKSARPHDAHVSRLQIFNGLRIISRHQVAYEFL
jgi:hypothetical protein